MVAVGDVDARALGLEPPAIGAKSSGWGELARSIQTLIALRRRPALGLVEADQCAQSIGAWTQRTCGRG